MPRPYTRPRPPCPAPACQADLRKHDTHGGGQRYRCPVCGALVKPGRSADWVALAAGVLAGLSLPALAEHMGAEEKSVRAMLAAWARRAQQRHLRQPAGVGQGWWWKSVGGYQVAVGVMRGGKPRVVGWRGGPAPPGVALTKPLLAGTGPWVKQILVGANGDPADEVARLWVAMARTNAWRLD